MVPDFNLKVFELRLFLSLYQVSDAVAVLEMFFIFIFQVVGC